VAHHFGQPGERIAFGGVEPAAAQIERQIFDIHRMRTAADTLHGFYEQDRTAPVVQPARCGDSRRSSSHDDYFGCHSVPASA